MALSWTSLAEPWLKVSSAYPATSIRCPGGRIAKRASSLALSWTSLEKPWQMVSSACPETLVRCPKAHCEEGVVPGAALDVLGEAVANGELRAPGNAGPMPQGGALRKA